MSVIVGVHNSRVSVIASVGNSGVSVIASVHNCGVCTRRELTVGTKVAQIHALEIIL